MIKWRTALIILVVLGSVCVAQGRLMAAPLFQQDLNVITFPGDSATVSGVVEIIGTASHPNFNSYGVLYAPGPAPTGESQWVAINFGVEQEVVGGSLALWDTTAFTEDGQPVVPNGTYTLALARYRDGSSEPDLYYVRNITVNNEDVTPTPAATPEPLATAVPVTPTPVPVEQPPTLTPRASDVAEPEETQVAPVPISQEETGEEQSSPLDLGRLRDAFIRGARTTIILFVVWGLYVAGRTAVRYFLRNRELQPPAGEP